MITRIMVAISVYPVNLKMIIGVQARLKTPSVFKTVDCKRNPLVKNAAPNQIETMMYIIQNISISMQPSAYVVMLARSYYMTQTFILNNDVIFDG